LISRYGHDLALPVMGFLGGTLWPLGIGEGARRLVEKSVTHAVGTKHIPTIALAYLHNLNFEMIRRDHVRSSSYARALLELTREHGMPAFFKYSNFAEGWLRCHAGDYGEGVTQMRDSLHPLYEQSCGCSPGLSLCGVMIAEAEAEVGHHDAALATIDAELSRMTHTRMFWYFAEAHRVRGELLLKSKPADVEPAEAAFTRAIEVARGQSAKRYEFRAATRLARLWTLQGERARHQGLLAILAKGLADGSDLDGFWDAVPVPNDLAGH
jgi:predicted ATPase